MPIALMLLLAPFAVVYVVHALAPEIQPDAYTYHLGLVREWLRGGDRPVGFYEMLPHGAEILFLPAYALAGPVGAKLVHFAFLGGLLPHLVNGPVALMLLLRGRARRDTELPFGPALLVGALLAVVWVRAAAR